MNQDSLPLYYSLVEHMRKNPISFHVPGHKNGLLFANEKYHLFQNILKLDQTELSGLDDLHSANDVIYTAQKLTADLYHVLNSFFLVGGSTAGNLTMILTACEENDMVLVARNSHKSIFHGLKLAKAHPILLSPEFDVEGQFSTNISYETIEKAIKAFPNAKALILTTPNYYGYVSKHLKKIIDLAHSNGLIVLADEAHGAHFILGDPFPSSAVKLGADMVVHSAHKTLPAMTMGAYLHCNSSQVDMEKLRYYLQVLQSSSPSYPIMASLDIARYYLAHITETDKRNITKQIHTFMEDLSAIPQVRVLKHEREIDKGDLLKVIVQTRCQLTGYALQKELEKENIYTELADPWNVLFIFPLGMMDRITETINKIKEITKSYSTSEFIRKKYIPNNNYNKITTLDVSFDKMKKYGTKSVLLQDAIGRIAAMNVIPYPPGIPFILEGERITANHIDELFRLKQQGAHFQNDKQLWESGILIYK